MFNIRQDPFEYFDQAPGPLAHAIQAKAHVFHAAGEVVAAHLATFEAFPPVQKGTSPSFDEAMEAMLKGKNA